MSSGSWAREKPIIEAVSFPAVRAVNLMGALVGAVHPKKAGGKAALGHAAEETLLQNASITAAAEI